MYVPPPPVAYAPAPVAIAYRDNDDWCARAWRDHERREHQWREREWRDLGRWGYQIDSTLKYWQVPIMKLNHRVSTFVAVAALGLAVAGTADAAGCLKGAVVGGVAGHYAGHHAVAGAVSDCIVGHHVAKKHTEERAA